MQLGVYSLVTPDYKTEEAAALIAEVGYSGVEWTVDYQNALWDGKSNWHIDSSNLGQSSRAARKASDRNGLTIVSLGTRCTCTDLDGVRLCMKVACEVGAPAIRVMASGYDGSRHYDDLLAKAREGYAAVQEEAQRTGVKALVEIHNGLICPSAAATRRMLDGLDPQRVGVIFDPGNMIREGMERWQMALEMLGPYLATVHVKNGGWLRGADGKWATREMGLAEGMVDWPAVIAALRKVGYDGWLDVEDFRGGWAKASEEFPTRRKLEEDFEYLSGLIG
jgi:sugar phosphate isomerase/epimerase